MSVPATQRAWRVTGKGVPSKVLRLDTDVPVHQKLAKGEVLVKVQAAALNPVGYKIMKHAPGFLVKRPYIPEHDLAGVVVDANGTELEQGEQVFGWLPVREFPTLGSLTPLLIRLRRERDEDPRWRTCTIRPRPR